MAPICGWSAEPIYAATQPIEPEIEHVCVVCARSYSRGGYSSGLFETFCSARCVVKSLEDGQSDG